MHLTEKQLSEYTNRTLAPAELLGVDDHLADCADCCKNLSSVLQANSGGTGAVNFFIEGLTAIGEDFHLSLTHITGYVDQQLAPAEQQSVRDHLQICPPCRAEVEDLQLFQSTLSQPVSVAPPLPVAAIPKWREVVRAFRPRAWLVLPVAAAAGIAIFAIGFYARSTPEPIAQQLAASLPPVATTTNSATPETSPTPLPTPSPTALSAEEGIVQQALATGRVEIPAAVKMLRGKGGNLMSGTPGRDSFTVFAPQGVMVESEQPRLHWSSLPEAKHYVVTITDQDFNEVARSQTLTTVNWSVPVKLKRGALYQWQVTATTVDGKELTAPLSSAPEAQFKVLSHEAFGTVRHARQRYGASHLELGVIYARVGLLAEAEQAFKSAGKQSPIALHLLKHLQQQLR